MLKLSKSELDAVDYRFLYREFLVRQALFFSTQCNSSNCSVNYEQFPHESDTQLVQFS